MKVAGSDRVVGVDIGGANLKYASDQGDAYARSFELWRHADRLSEAIQQDLARFAAIDTLAVTMTGELADCFLDREIGVRHIVRATQQAAEVIGVGRVLYYGVDGNFLSAEDAADNCHLIASANWHALVKYVASQFISNGLLVDVGSTTTDIIPIRDGSVATDSRNDYDRLTEGSLVYVGCRRTPVCALLDRLNLDGRNTPVMNELFATIDDARLVLGKQPECHGDTDSADGQPRTREFAANRLARMIGLDRRQLDLGQATQLAVQVHDAARLQIREALQRISATSRGPMLLSGHGQDMVDLPSDTEIRQLSDKLGDEVSRCAPAYAVACLCCEHRPPPSRVLGP